MTSDLATAIERLEQRSYLSLTWVNRNFQLGGSQLATADVEYAIDRWNEVLPASVSLNLSITVETRPANSVDQARTGVDGNGNATIVLYSDPSPGKKWYFAPVNLAAGTLTDTALYGSFDTANGLASPTPFARDIALGGETDFVTVALEQVGQAVGDSESVAVGGAGEPTTGPATPSSANDLLDGTIPPDVRRVISALDSHLLGGQAPEGITNLVVKGTNDDVTASTNYPDRVVLTWDPTPFVDHYIIYTYVGGVMTDSIDTPPGSGAKGTFTLTGALQKSATYVVQAPYVDPYFGLQGWNLGQAVGSLGAAQPPPSKVPPTAALNRHPFAYVSRNGRYAYLPVVFNGSNLLDNSSIKAISLGARNGFSTTGNLSATQSLNGGRETVATYVFRTLPSWATSSPGLLTATIATGGIKDVAGNSLPNTIFNSVRLVFS